MIIVTPGVGEQDRTDTAAACKDKGRGKCARIAFSSESASDFPIHLGPSKKKQA